MAIVLTALGLTGCLNLKPAPDLTRNFVLTPAIAPTETPRESTLSVGFAPVRLPAHASRSWIAIRTGPNEIHYSETARWADPLERNVQRVMGVNLRRLLGSDAVFLNTWPGGAVQHQVSLRLEAFELGLDGDILIAAQWTIESPQSGGVLKVHAARIERSGPAPGGDMPGAVAALSEALGDLSRRMAQSLQPSGL